MIAGIIIGLAVGIYAGMRIGGHRAIMNITRFEHKERRRRAKL